MKVYGWRCLGCKDAGEKSDLPMTALEMAAHYAAKHPVGEHTRFELWVDYTGDPPEQVMVVLAGKSFRCDCGGNVFTSRGENYTCNSCQTIYRGVQNVDVSDT